MTDEAAGIRGRILVADDDAWVREISARILRQAGYAVDVAADGECAWEALTRGRYDLLLTDENMPRLTGRGLIARLHEAGMGIPVILMSGGSYRPEGEHPPVFIAKPFSSPVMLGEVGRQLALAC